MDRIDCRVEQGWGQALLKKMKKMMMKLWTYSELNGGEVAAHDEEVLEALLPRLALGPRVVDLHHVAVAVVVVGDGLALLSVLVVGAGLASGHVLVKDQLAAIQEADAQLRLDEVLPHHVVVPVLIARLARLMS
jgi:hypothetical protein